MEPNAPLGLWPGLEFTGEHIDNIRQRRLFLYTDGLNEAVTEHAAGADPSDDLTMMCIKLL